MNGISCHGQKNDATSCYDRIICNLAMMVSQHFGVTREAASMQAETLENMIFRIRTAIGDSNVTTVIKPPHQYTEQVKGAAHHRHYGS